MNEEVKSSKKPIIIAVLAILIILGIAIYYFISFRASRENPISYGQNRVDAKAGSIISSFPKEFILEQNITPKESYSIVQTDGEFDQPVVEYQSSKNLMENTQMFSDFLAKNGWTIDNYANPLAQDSTFFYAKKDNQTANITFIISPDKKVTVRISVLKNNN